MIVEGVRLPRVATAAVVGKGAMILAVTSRCCKSGAQGRSCEPAAVSISACDWKRGAAAVLPRCARETFEMEQKLLLLPWLGLSSSQQLAVAACRGQVPTIRYESMFVTSIK